MAKTRRAPVSLKREPALQASRVVLGNLKLVYVLVTDKPLKYPTGKSRIAYIGTTRNGVARIAQSVAARSDSILRLAGVTMFQARVVTCRPRQNVKMWHKLERALLIAFRDAYGAVPMCNSKGSKLKETNEFTLLARSRVNAVLADLA